MSFVYSVRCDKYFDYLVHLMKTSNNTSFERNQFKQSKPKRTEPKRTEPKKP